MEIDKDTKKIKCEIPDKRKKKAVWVTGEGVEEAMRELSEMEHKLQNAVKRQRQAVESSDLHVKAESTMERNIRPKMRTPPPNDTIPSNCGRNAESVEKAPMDNYQAELAAGDIVDAKADDEGFERGANRPPPVNSDRLPLPWSGRLGYVSASP